MDVWRNAGREMTDLAGASVVFRTDASLQIGSGHVVRCLALAAALRDRGARCHFIGRALDGHLLDLVTRAGHHVTRLAAMPDYVDCAPSVLAHAGWLEVAWEIDARQTLAAIGSQKVDWLVVDHYALDIAWEAQLRTAAKNILAIDDLADRRHECDVLLDQNLGRQAADYAPLVPKQCQTIVGPQFAMLRPEFAAQRELSLARRRSHSRLGHILVTMGGVDRDNVTCAVLEGLRKAPLAKGIRITVVMGAAAPDLASVQALSAAMPRPTELCVGVEDMAALMSASDLAIGAAGGTAWERCCLGLPSLVVAVAGNQRLAAQALDRAGAAVQLGEPSEVARSLPAALSRVESPCDLTRFSLACSRIADGLGAERVASRMAEFNG